MLAKWMLDECAGFTPNRAEVAMPLEARHDDISVYESDATQSLGGVVPTLKWRYVTRLLEVTVWLLMAVWGIQVFTMWVKFLQWGTLIDFPQ